MTGYKIKGSDSGVVRTFFFARALKLYMQIGCIYLEMRMQYAVWQGCSEDATQFLCIFPDGPKVWLHMLQFTYITVEEWGIIRLADCRGRMQFKSWQVRQVIPNDLNMSHWSIEPWFMTTLHLSPRRDILRLFNDLRARQWTFVQTSMVCATDRFAGYIGERIIVREFEHGCMPCMWAGVDPLRCRNK